MTALENVRVALQQKMGTSFHFWKSERSLRELDDQVMQLLAEVDLAAVKNASRTADDTLESEARRICEQQLVDNADLLVVNTEQEARDLAEHYDAERDIIRVVSPGADVAYRVQLTQPSTSVPSIAIWRRRM